VARSSHLPQGVQVTGPIKPGYESILTHDELALVARLDRAVEGRRQDLLKARVARQARIDAGEMPDFLPETAYIRAGDWPSGCSTTCGMPARKSGAAASRICAMTPR
jgi:malate synthase